MERILFSAEYHRLLCTLLKTATRRVICFDHSHWRIGVGKNSGMGKRVWCILSREDASEGQRERESCSMREVRRVEQEGAPVCNVFSSVRRERLV